MSNETSIVPVESPVATLPAMQAQGDAAPELFDPYKLIRRALRGRYLLAAVLALALASVGVYVGWKKGPVTYRSEGIVRIAYSIQTPMPESDQRISEAIFEAFLQSQQALLSSRDMVDAAIAEPVWHETGRGTSSEAITEFTNGLKVEHKPGTDFLRIMFDGPDPNLAAVAVHAVINAYQHKYQSQQDQLQRQAQRTLEQQEKDLAAQLDRVQRQIRTMGGGMGPAAIDNLFDAQVKQVTKLEEMLTDIRIALVLSQGQATVAATVQQIAAADPMMREYLLQRGRLEDQLMQMRRRNYGENHPQMQSVRDELAALNTRIEEFAKAYSQNQQSAPRPTAAGPVPGELVFIGQPVKSLQEHLVGLEKLYTETKGKMLQLGGQRVQVESLKAEADTLGKNLADASRRLQVFQLQASGISGSLSVVASGQTPMQPFLDRRPVAAVAGGVAGAMLPIALLALLGVAGTRYRFSDETESDLANRAMLLGILPTLSGRLSDSEAAADAAQCVHHIRVVLQMRGGRNAKHMYLVTSASAGEGKTSLTAALGLSFAAAGCRTLLIDGDLVGQHLTSGFEAEGIPGLYDALEHGAVNGYVKNTHQKGLWLLPAGRADVLHASVVSTTAMQQLLEEVAANYEVVLIDSGPILGSVEASVMAPQVPGVILTVSRRQQRPLVEKAVRHLDSVGAKITGIVFNRANRSDFDGSAHSTSMRSAPYSGALVRAAGSRVQAPALGPLVQSVARFLPRPVADNGKSRKHGEK